MGGRQESKVWNDRKEGVRRVYIVESRGIGKDVVYDRSNEEVGTWVNWRMGIYA